MNRASSEVIGVFAAMAIIVIIMGILAGIGSVVASAIEDHNSPAEQAELEKQWAEDERFDIEMAEEKFLSHIDPSTTDSFEVGKQGLLQYDDRATYKNYGYECEVVNRTEEDATEFNVYHCSK